jgi:DNA uptake protein ComE-like DNA-binding protein
VKGATLDILFGEDANMNGVLDLNENDALVAMPDDNRDSRLDPGLFEYVTVYSRQPNANRTNINTVQQFQPLLQQSFGNDRARQILQSAGLGQTQGGQTISYRSLLEFYVRVQSQMTADEFAQISGAITATTTNAIPGLVNVNTASAEVLACIPGIGPEFATSLVSYRQANPDKLTSIAWVMDVLERTNAVAGRYLTTESYQFSADIAAVGHYGRGYSRARFIFDTSEGAPKIRQREDLTRLGWALGSATRQKLLLAKDMSTR